MPIKLQTGIEGTNNQNSELLDQPIENLTLEPEGIIEVRELDKRHTHANPKKGMCTMDNCTNKATHWLTRNNAHYCQSDMVCHQHAVIWMEVKELLVVSD